MVIFTVANRKGGVGKTTTAVHLAAGLADKGYKTILVDLCSQGNAALALGIEPFAGLVELLFMGGYTDGARDTGIDNLWLVGSDHTTIDAAETLAGDRSVSLQDTAKFLYPCWDNSRDMPYCPCDYLVLDSPPAGWFQELAIHVADLLIVPASPDILAADAVLETMQTANQLHDLRTSTLSRLILPTMTDHTKETGRMIAALVDLGFPMARTEVPRRVAIREAAGEGRTIYQSDPKNAAAVAYSDLVQWCIQNGRPAGKGVIRG